MAKLKRHLPMSVTIAIIVHVAAVVLFVVGYQMKREYAPSQETAINTVKATVINSEKLAEEKKRKEEEVKRKQQEKQRQLSEQKRLAQERLKQQEEKTRLEVELATEKKKVQEAQQRAELEQKKAQEVKKQAELEKQRLEEEIQKKAEEQRLAELKKAEEAKKLAEEEQRKEQERLAAEQAAEQESLAKILEQEEAELKAAESEAQRIAKAREMSRFNAQYLDALRSRIQSRWRKPLNEQPNAWCKVYVRQAPGGYVENVVVEQCTGDEAFRRSVEEAVWKSDPLPEPPSPELFDRDLRFEFDPEI